MERNGTECVPKAEKGTLLEPTFGLFKGTDGYHDAVDCYNQCSNCLTEEIKTHQGATTSCKYVWRKDDGMKYDTCTVGFDYAK